MFCCCMIYWRFLTLFDTSCCLFSWHNSLELRKTKVTTEVMNVLICLLDSYKNLQFDQSCILSLKSFWLWKLNPTQKENWNQQSYSLNIVPSLCLHIVVRYHIQSEEPHCIPMTALLHYVSIWFCLSVNFYGPLWTLYYLTLCQPDMWSLQRLTSVQWSPNLVLTFSLNPDRQLSECQRSA